MLIYKSAIDKGKRIIAIFIDFCSAFKVINRKFDRKISKYGVKYIVWLKLYGKIKTVINVEKGAPQGSAFGSLTFNIYENDISI